MSRLENGPSDSSLSERTPLLEPQPPEPIAEDAERGAEQDANGEAEANGNGAPIADEPSTKKLLLIMGSIWVGVFFNALDSTVVATLSAPISTSFNSFTMLSWIASSYLIANAALQPLTGRLTDIFSRRTGLLFSNVFFCTGTLMCGLAQNEWAMIFGRVIAGIGGGGLNSISTFIGSDLIPLRRRGVWQGIGNLCYGLGSGLGGVYGGMINDAIGWRWAFLIQVPFLVLSAILVYFNVDVPVKETSMSRLRRVDFTGAILLVSSLVFLLLGLNAGGNIIPWSDPRVIASLVLSVVTFVAFIYVEDKVASEPIIPVRLCLERTVLCACLTNWFETMALFSVFFYGPVYFQVRGFSATQAGIRFVPQALGIAFGSLGAGTIMRVTGKYWTLHAITGAIFVAASVMIAATFDLNTPVWTPFVYFFLMGLGYCSMLTVTLIALISAVDHEHQAVITSASYAFRSTGSSIGITIASAVFQNLLKSKLWGRFGNEPGAAEEIARLRDSIDEINHVPESWKLGVLLSFMEALSGVWWTVVGIGALGVVISLFMKEHTLHSTLSRK